MDNDNGYIAKLLYNGEMAEDYDKVRFSNFKGELYSLFEKWSITRALRKFDIASLVLDIPCGTGRITQHIASLGYRVQGADISDDMLTIARGKTGAVCRHTDIEHTSFMDKSFDVAVCVRLMGHLPYATKVKALSELKRIARYVVVTFYTEGIWELKHLCRWRPPWYPISDADIAKLLKECGLRVISKHYVCPLWSDGVTYVLV